MQETTFVHNDPDRGPSIQTRWGGEFFLLSPRPEDIYVSDIAYATSMLCRFTGHTNRFYSVAQHCVMVSRIVPPEMALTGLFHDATEAYIGDLSKPLKVALDQLAPGVVTQVEERIHVAIAARVSHLWPFPPEIKHADNVALATEKRDLMPGDKVRWFALPDPLPYEIQPLDPIDAERQFLARYEEILSGTEGMMLRYA